MRTKISRLPAIPAKYQRYHAADWPGGWSQFVAERETWNSMQAPVLYAGGSPAGLSWAYEAGPLGDSTDEMRARREARMIASGQAECGLDWV